MKAQDVTARYRPFPDWAVGVYFVLLGLTAVATVLLNKAWPAAFLCTSAIFSVLHGDRFKEQNEQIKAALSWLIPSVAVWGVVALMTYAVKFGYS